MQCPHPYPCPLPIGLRPIGKLAPGQGNPAIMLSLSGELTFQPPCFGENIPSIPEHWCSTGVLGCFDQKLLVCLRI